MKDIVEISAPNLLVNPGKSPALANYKDFITFEAIVKGDGGALLRGQNVLFSISGSYARFRELANQKIVGTTDSSGTVTVHLMSNNLDKGTVTVTIVDSAGQSLSASQSFPYEFIKDPALGIAVAIEHSGAKADGAEQNIVAVSLTDSGQPLANAPIHAKVDGKALFVPDGYNETQATTDSRGIARFYLVDGNNLHENVNFTAYYEQAQWLQASTVVAFADAYNFDLSAQVLSNFNLPDTSPNIVKIKLLNNEQIAPGFEILCTLPAASGATFVKNGAKELREKTDGTGCLTVEIKDAKVEKIDMEVYVVIQPDTHISVDLEWQRYEILLKMLINNSLPDGIAQNRIQATVKNNGVLVPSEELVFQIDDRSQSHFVGTGNRTIHKTTEADGTAIASMVSTSFETYPVTVALFRYPPLNSSIDSTFGAYVLTVLETKNNANGDGKDENWVKVSLQNNNKTVPGKKLFCEMLSKKAIFTSNNQYTSEVTTGNDGVAVIHMVGTGSFQDTLKVSVEDDYTVFKEVVLNWRKYTISQVNRNEKFVVGTIGKATVQVKDNGTAVGGIDVQFSSPYNTTVKTDSYGNASAYYNSSEENSVSSAAYLKGNTSVSTSLNIEFVNRYESTYPYKTYVSYGYDLTYRITDNLTGKAASNRAVDAVLYSNVYVTDIAGEIWFENHVGDLKPQSKSFTTDGNGMLVIPVRYLLNRPPYSFNEALVIYIDGQRVINYLAQNF